MGLCIQSGVQNYCVQSISIVSDGLVYLAWGAELFKNYCVQSISIVSVQVADSHTALER